MSQVKPIPDGYHTLTPYLAVRGASKAIDFYKNAFGASEMFRMPGPGDAIMHAEMRVGDSVFMISDEAPDRGSTAPPTIGGTAVSMFLYVTDVDASFARATKAGCSVQMPPMDMPWGDRFAKLQDPFGHLWGMATHKEDVTPEEVARRMSKGQ